MGGVLSRGLQKPLPLRDVVVYPYMVHTLFVGRDTSKRALEKSMGDDKKILLVAQKDASQDKPGVDDIYDVGCVSTIMQLVTLPDGTLKVLVEGGQRAHILRYVDTDAYFEAQVELLESKPADAREVEVLTRAVVAQFEQYARAHQKVRPEVLASLSGIDDPSRLADTIAAHLVMDPTEFDVIVTTNQFGDILTDLGAGLVGGLGLAPGLCVGHNQAMSQATHGSAPDISGQNIANPYAMIMSGKMLFDWLGRERDEPKASKAAGLIDAAMEKVIAEATSITRDIGGSASTQEMGDAISQAIS